MHMDIVDIYSRISCNSAMAAYADYYFGLDMRQHTSLMLFISRPGKDGTYTKTVVNRYTTCQCRHHLKHTPKQSPVPKQDSRHDKQTENTLQVATPPPQVFQGTCSQWHTPEYNHCLVESMKVLLPDTSLSKVRQVALPARLSPVDHSQLPYGGSQCPSRRRNVQRLVLDDLMTDKAFSV